MRLNLDPTHCDGLGVCAQILPELVHLDEWGFPILAESDTSAGTGFETDRRSVEVPADLEHLAHRAVYSCPRLALRLDD